MEAAGGGSPLCLLPTTITPVQMILQLLALAQPCPAVGGAACAREVSVSRLAGLAAQYGTAGLTELVSAEPEDKGWVFPKALRVEQDSRAAGACGPPSGGSVSSPRFTHDVHHRLSSRVTGALSVLPDEKGWLPASGTTRRFLLSAKCSPSTNRNPLLC